MMSGAGWNGPSRLLERFDMRRILLFLLAFLIVSAGCAPAAMPATSPLSPVATPAPQPFQLTLVHSNDTWGYLLPCG
jgi:2',3'-cyclic-nucleotide 2'-phosphodiesterase (5'-nucleotidase family)